MEHEIIMGFWYFPPVCLNTFMPGQLEVQRWPCQLRSLQGLLSLKANFPAGTSVYALLRADRSLLTPPAPAEMLPTWDFTSVSCLSIRCKSHH